MTDDSGRGAQPPSYGAVPPFPQPGYGQPGYGQPPVRPPRRRRTGLWVGLGVGGGIVAILIVIVVIAALAGSKSSSTSSKGGLPATALGPSACVPSGKLTSGAGPWKLIVPKTLCGIPMDNSAQGKQGDQEAISTAKLVFDVFPGQPNPGSYTSAVAAAWETPDGLGVFRFVNYVGFNGSFPSPQVAVTALAGLDTNPDIAGDVFANVNPGPHGGAMQCAPDGSTSEECVFATTTTLGDITISDTSKELTAGHSDTTAIDIRDFVEVKA